MKDGHGDNSDIPLAKPSHRMEKVNAQIRRVFGEILQREAALPADVMVTISNVETAGDLSAANVWLSVFPASKAKIVLRKIRPQMYHLQGVFNKQMHMRPLPRLSIKIDHGAEYADKIERRLKELD